MCLLRRLALFSDWILSNLRWDVVLESSVLSLSISLRRCWFVGVLEEDGRMSRDALRMLE